MRAVVQRVAEASVSVNGETRGQIGFGLLVYLGVAIGDTAAEADWLADKIANLRIFNDSEGKMNLSLLEIAGCAAGQADAGSIGILAISQFTLLGDARKGRRPSWAKAAPPDKAKELYRYFMGKIRETGLRCEEGEFQAFMQVRYTNDGPVTIILDTSNE